jgi:cytochrome c553
MLSRAFPCIAAWFILSLLLSVANAQQGRTLDFGRVDPSAANFEAGLAVVVGNFGQAAQSQQGACFRCHGVDGKGDGAAAFPRLTGQVYKYLYDALKDYASGARNNAVMSPIALALTDQQMRDVAAYYAAQRDAPHDPRPEINADQLQYGAALAAVGSATRGVQGCTNCHGIDGAGLPPTYPYLAGQYANYLEAQLRAWKTGARRGGASGGIMEQIAKRLTDEDIRAVSLYFARMRPLAATPEQTQARQSVAVPSAGVGLPTR